MPLHVVIGLGLMFIVIVVGLVIIVAALAAILYQTLYKWEKIVTTLLFRKQARAEEVIVSSPTVWDRDLDGAPQPRIPTHPAKPVDGGS